MWGTRGNEKSRALCRSLWTYMLSKENVLPCQEKGSLFCKLMLLNTYPSLSYFLVLFDKRQNHQLVTTGRPGLAVFTLCSSNTDDTHRRHIEFWDEPSPIIAFREPWTLVVRLCIHALDFVHASWRNLRPCFLNSFIKVGCMVSQGLEVFGIKE